MLESFTEWLIKLNELMTKNNIETTYLTKSQTKSFETCHIDFYLPYIEISGL